jgi:hypothetical protein
MKTNAGDTTDEYATSLETLRKRCFVFGSEMMKNFPAQIYRPCPALWIDGYGTVLGAGQYSKKKNITAYSIHVEYLCAAKQYGGVESWPRLRSKHRKEVCANRFFDEVLLVKI